MKVKILTLATLFLFGQFIVNGQTFKKGDKVLNLGVGFGGYGPSGYGIVTPSASASFEVGIKDSDSNKGSLGIGGYLGYASYNQNGNYVGNNYWTVNRILIGARGAYHFPLADKLDTYAGITVGYISRSWKWNGAVNRTDHPSRTPFSSDLFIGGRYYFSDKFGMMGELAFSAYLTLGISMKF